MDIRRFKGAMLRRVAFLVCFVLGWCVALIPRPFSDEKPSTTTPQPASTATLRVEQPSEPPREEDRNSVVVPQAFAGIDFENYSFGSYRLFSGKRIDLRLQDGRLEYAYPDMGLGWFAFRNVYYADVTGDGAPEAIVMLSHVQCGASCDGGSTLIYIYAARKRGLQRIWRYETGSYAYGCGMKSFTVENKQIVLETFGRCPKQAMEYPGPGKSKVDDETRAVFRFNGKRVVRSELKFLSVPTRDVKNYQPEIRIG